MNGIKGGIDEDLHGETLNYFYEITRRIFRWKQAEDSAGTRLQAIDMALKSTPG